MFKRVNAKSRQNESRKTRPACKYVSGGWILLNQVQTL